MTYIEELREDLDRAIRNENWGMAEILQARLDELEED